MLENFERRYYVNDHGLYAVDTWTVNGRSCESRTTDIGPEDAEADREEIGRAFLLHDIDVQFEAEGTAVYAPESASGLERRCDRGHRNVSRSEIGAGWRQVS